MTGACLDDYVKSMLFSVCNCPRQLLFAAEEVDGVVVAPAEPDAEGDGDLAGDDGGNDDMMVTTMVVMMMEPREEKSRCNCVYVVNKQ